MSVGHSRLKARSHCRHGHVARWGVTVFSAAVSILGFFRASSSGTQKRICCTVVTGAGRNRSKACATYLKKSINVAGSGRSQKWHLGEDSFQHNIADKNTRVCFHAVTSHRGPQRLLLFKDEKFLAFLKSTVLVLHTYRCMKRCKPAYRLAIHLAVCEDYLLLHFKHISAHWGVPRPS